MSLEFRRLDKSNVSDCIRGWIAAFPHWKYDDALERAREQVESMYFFGAYEDGEYKGLIVGADTSFNYRGTKLSGMELDHLHVEPLYRKEGVSRFLIQEFENFAKNNGYYMINVGPFSTEFYRNMGYGFGSKVMTLSTAPERFQHFENTTSILEYYDGEKYRDQVEQFVRDQRVSYHGSFNFKDKSLEDKFEKMRDKNRIVVLAIEEEKVTGLIHYASDRKITIEDIFFEGQKAIQALSSYMHSLKGNIQSITIENSYPEILAICNEPKQIELREESMVKVINMKRFLDELKNVVFDIEDMEMEFRLHIAINGEIESIYLVVENGKMHTIEKSDCKVQIEMELSDFSTMLFSQQTFRTYYQVGLATINDKEFVEPVHKLFAYRTIPFNI